MSCFLGAGPILGDRRAGDLAVRQKGWVKEWIPLTPPSPHQNPQHAHWKWDRLVPATSNLTLELKYNQEGLANFPCCLEGLHD